MTARTKGQKLKLRRGRVPLPATVTTREPNGRPSRRKQRTELLEHQILEVGTSRRIRHLGLVAGRDAKGNPITAAQVALDPRQGYLLGRLQINGTINKTQHDAGLRYAEDIARYHGLTGVPFPSARAQNLFAVAGSGGEDSQDRGNRARAASDKRTKLRAVLLTAGDINTGRRVEHTVQVVCVEDIDGLRTLNGLMAELLRKGLNKLASYYGI